jgi:hypothetical protein
MIVPLLYFGNCDRKKELLKILNGAHATSSLQTSSKGVLLLVDIRNFLS